MTEHRNVVALSSGSGSHTRLAPGQDSLGARLFSPGALRIELALLVVAVAVASRLSPAIAQFTGMLFQ